MEITFNLPYKVKTIENNNKDMEDFSIVIIARNNEQELLTNLLNSLTDFKNSGGDIVILDIDLREQNKEIIRNLGYNIEDGTNFTRIIDSEMSLLINERFKKDNNDIIKANNKYIDCSGARDYAASLAKNDMILMLDSSTYIIEFNFSEIRNFIKEDYSKIMFTAHNKKDLVFEYNVCEFYNRKKYKWTNVVHEELLLVDSEKIGNIPESLLRIQLNDKKLINRKEILVGLAVNCFLIAKNEIVKFFALALSNFNFTNSSLSEFNRYLTMIDSKYEKSTILVTIGDLLIKGKKFDEGLEYYHKAYLEYSNWRQPLYKLGEYFFQRSIWDKCILYLEGCLNIQRPPHQTSEDDFLYKDGPYSMLYVAYWWFGDIKKGKFYFDKALETNPYNTTYLAETGYHYSYKGNNIPGPYTFKEIQFLYNLSKNYSSILEINPENGRATHAFLNGCDGLITIITSNNNYENILNNLEKPGNLRIITDDQVDEIKNEKFDIIFINCDTNDIKNNMLEWEFKANKIICGYHYNRDKTKIDELFEIDGTENNIWYKKISQFEKTIIFKRKINC